jgi:penicillin-binding protein 1C
MTVWQIIQVVYQLRRRIIVGGMCLLLASMLTLAWSRSTLHTPAPSYLLVDKHGKFLAEIQSPGSADFGYWTQARLPARVVKATITLEDKRFWHHVGIDPLAMARALWQNLSSRQRVSGASTLAMQLIRLQHPAARTYTNKAIESLAAILMTWRYGREQVLRHYLRQVPYGNRIHGIVYAARRYLNKPVADLSWAEIAFLAAIPQSPGRMNPFERRGRLRAIKRGRFLLSQLYRQHALSRAAYQLAVDELVRINMPRHRQRPEYAMHAIEYLQRRLTGNDPPSKGGLLKTTLDLDLQTQITLQCRRLLQQWRRHGAGNLALIVLDRNTNNVLTWIGSADYFDKDYAGAIDYTQVKRSPGSTLKPFIYALALERGVLQPNEVLDDLPFAGYPFRNSDHNFLGPMLPRQALANSRNIPAIRVLNTVGMNETYYLLNQLKLHKQTAARDSYGLGLAIGSMPVRLADLVRAYAVLANDGKFRSLHWFADSPPAPQQRVFSRATARLISLWLSDPMARLPTFPRMGTEEYPFPVAVKTGTSQGYRDAWTVAYSRRYLVGAWVGDPDMQPMYKLSGAGSAAALVQQVLLKLQGKQQEARPDQGFPPPPHFVAVDLCGISGKLVSPDCDYHFSEWLPPAQVPHEKDNSYLKLSIDTRTNQPAAAMTPVKYRKTRTFVNLPSQYADWVVHNQLIMARGRIAVTPTAVSDSLPSQMQVRLHIVSPQADGHYLRIPDAPSMTNDIAFSAVVDPPVEQILWYVDNQPYKLTDYPYTTRWQLTPGKHIIEARVPFTHEHSRPVSIYIEN